jgi:hypothetical protein
MHSRKGAQILTFQFTKPIFINASKAEPNWIAKTSLSYCYIQFLAIQDVLSQSKHVVIGVLIFFASPSISVTCDHSFISDLRVGC